MLTDIRLVETKRHNLYHSPTKENADGNVRNKPSLYIVNVTAKYMARLPRTKTVFTAVQ